MLRLENGTPVELFDDAGAVASGSLVLEHGIASVRVDQLAGDHSPRSAAITVAAAIPKGERADWMVEKLSELGVAAFIPLAAERSVVLPEGTHKRERWQRIATESAKQSRRHGVMRIESIAKIESLVARSPLIALSTRGEVAPLPNLLHELRNAVTLLVGPEGGWTDAELKLFESAGVRFAKMTESILRIETAAVAAAALAAMLLRCS